MGLEAKTRPLFHFVKGPEHTFSIKFPNFALGGSKQSIEAKTGSNFHSNQMAKSLSCWLEAKKSVLFHLIKALENYFFIIIPNCGRVGQKFTNQSIMLSSNLKNSQSSCLSNSLSISLSNSATAYATPQATAYATAKATAYSFCPLDSILTPFDPNWPLLSLQEQNLETL